MTSDNAGKQFTHRRANRTAAVMFGAELCARGGDQTIAEMEEPSPGLVRVTYKTAGQPVEIHDIRYPEVQ